MHRFHDMPFGAAVGGDGRTRFRLWAPAAAYVTIELQDAGGRSAVPMNRLEDGWYEAHLAVGAGTRYAYRPDSGPALPDPASRFNPDDVHRPSAVVDPRAFRWQDANWQGRPWHEAVIYELHVGAFTPAGTFAAAAARLDYLAELGVTAVELMPIADFAGRRNWGYDGVLPFAPDASYGTPDDLKRLVEAAHRRGLMILLDVVYNHFGPEGNYLHRYAPDFVDATRVTPWGGGIAFDGPRARTVRDFFIHNALYWLEEYHFDGLRLDAVHAMEDRSEPHIVEEIARAVRAGPGRSRHVHIVLENDRNEARWLRRARGEGVALADAQWNDDIHHALHVLVTGEQDGYYADYVQRPLWHLGRCLAEGFSFQGESSGYRGGVRRGEPSDGLCATAFVNFLQTHDQVGNRAFGERIGALAEPRALAAATACLLLAPAPPLLFMGEEFLASTPFLFFCDFNPELAAAVTAGRRGEFAQFTRFADPAVRASIPDPNDASTFAWSKLRWQETAQLPHLAWLRAYRQLLRLRREHIVPRLAAPTARGGYGCGPDGGLGVRWTRGDGARLHLSANLSASPARAARPRGHLLYSTDGRDSGDELAPWSVRWTLETADG